MRSGRILFCVRPRRDRGGGCRHPWRRRAQARSWRARASRRRSSRRMLEPDAHFEYVASVGAIYVYSIDHRNRLVQTISLPGIGSSVHGMVASPARTARLYMPPGPAAARWLRCSPSTCGGAECFGPHLSLRDRQHGDQPQRSLDLHAGGREVGRGHLAGHRTRPNGTAVGSHSSTGRRGAHNTIIGLTASTFYLGGVDYPYLEVASTATSRVVRKIGPLQRAGRPPLHDQRLTDARLHHRKRPSSASRSAASHRRRCCTRVPDRRVLVRPEDIRAHAGSRDLAVA